MADKKISELVELSTPVQSDVVPIVDSATTKKITLKNLVRKPVIAGGDISGTVTVDLSVGNMFAFTLVGNVDVTIENALDGEKFYFIVTNSGSNNVDSIAVTGGTFYGVGSTVPNVTNNGIDVFEAICVGSDIYMWSHKNMG
jgi:hypothetical protein